MLIPFNIVANFLRNNNIEITGILHIGAHECEEYKHYISECISPNDIIWIEALHEKVTEMKNKNIPNIYNAVISDKEGEVIFNISNNDFVENNRESSSILEFETHSKEHPHVKFIEKRRLNTITLTKFFNDNKLNVTKYNFWNIDIQGAELLALKGATKSIQYAKLIYLEVNEKELYKGCGLIGDIDAFLSQYNFQRVLTNMTSHGWGDAIYIIPN
jgi:FkbM family methyltransferase